MGETITGPAEFIANRLRPAAGSRQRGFTLMELMIVVAIVAILAAIALPSYAQYVIRANRKAAQTQMVEIANRQQQFFIANRAYADTAGIQSTGYALPSELQSRYTWAVTLPAGTIPGFTVTFTPIGGQASDGALTLDSAGTKTPVEKWK